MPEAKKLTNGQINIANTAVQTGNTHIWPIEQQNLVQNKIHTLKYTFDKLLNGF